MKVFNRKFYILGFMTILFMGGVLIYTFRTLFTSLTLAFEVETKIPESELRINKQNLEKAYDSVYEFEPTELDIAKLTNQVRPSTDEETEEETSTEER